MKIPMVKVPTFTTTLPVSGDKVEFRPFLVKEEKLLLLANDSEDNEDVINAIQDLVQGCTFEKLNLNKYCLADIQWLFLQIRSKSIGKDIDMYMICGECDHKQLKTLDVTDFHTKSTQKIDHVIAIDDTVKVELRYPSLKHYVDLFEEQDENKIYDVVIDCIDKIYSDDEVFVNIGETNQELREFVDNLTAEQFEPFEQFFLNMPTLVKEVEFQCVKCGKDNNVIVDSLRNFFG